mmetsp:Transcript_96308/g.255887  ORF Transcript_96308/g.255887 Transcript_96308/m.255887 type:complete len:471 (-) Transcript_96308:101-1513(-)
MARRVAALAALLAASRISYAAPDAAAAEEDEALAEDDHCQSSNETCAVNALQARAKKVAAAAAAAENSPYSCQAYGCHSYERHRPCQCNSRCWHYGNCCKDYAATCSHSHSAASYSAPSPGGCYQTGKTYNLAWKAQGKNFFDDWTFVTEDMVHGAQQFVSRSEAVSQGIIAADSHSARLGIGGLRLPSRPDEAYKRYAPHIRTNQAWDPKDSMLVAMKYNTVPTGCGVWPGFWTVNSDELWPEGGELDIMEYANYDESKVSFHIGTHCHLDNRKIGQCLPHGSGGPGPSDCYTSYFKNAFGCRPRQHQRRGDQYDAIPGVIAAQWTSDSVTVYLFPDGQVPKDLEDDKPKPDGWTKYVVAYLPFSRPCEAIKPQEIVLNVQLCGDAAGGPWAKSICAKETQMKAMMGQCYTGLSQPADCCTQFVTSPQQEAVLKAKALFNVSYVKVFTPDGTGGMPSGTFKRGGKLLQG